jgi:hypothetical protein
MNNVRAASCLLPGDEAAGGIFVGASTVTIASYYCQLLLPVTIASYYCQLLLPVTIASYY